MLQIEMEYADGGSLDQLLKSHGWLSQRFYFFEFGLSFYAFFSHSRWSVARKVCAGLVSANGLCILLPNAFLFLYANKILIYLYVSIFYVGFWPPVYPLQAHFAPRFENTKCVFDSRRRGQNWRFRHRKGSP